MKTSAKLLLVALLGVMMLAPSVYPQNTKDQLNSLMTDSINLKNSVIKLQESSDQKNAEIIKLLNETLSRFATLESNMQKLNESLATTMATMKTNDEKSAKNLQDTRTALDALRKDLDAGMVNVEGQLGGLRKQFTDMKPAEQPLPTASDVFSHAYSQLSQGFYDDAISEFREFVKSYNDPVRVPEAVFYIGDALMAQKKFDQAVTQLDIFLDKYPNSMRKCLALYRKGQALVAQKQIPQATTVLTSVTKECAGTMEAANAAADLKSMPKPARGN